jgi:hypothetical protein
MAFVRTGGQTTAKANFRDFFRLGVEHPEYAYGGPPAG